MKKPPSKTIADKVHARVRAILDDPLPEHGPFPHYCQCGAPRWEHAGANFSGAHKPRNGAEPNGCGRWAEDRVHAAALAAIDADAETLLRVFARNERRHAPRAPYQPGQLSVRPSDSGECHRKVWYRNFTPEGLIEAPVDERAARAGGAFHKSLLDAVAEEYPWRLVEYPVMVPGLDREGRVDWYDPYTRTVGDGKTAGQAKWDRLGNDGPDETTWDQVYVYGLALSRAGWPVETVVLHYLARDSGREEPYHRPYTEERAREALSRLTGLASTLDAYRRAVEDGDVEDAEALIPARAGTGPEGFPCGWCKYRFHCWNVADADAANRHPTSYTVLGPDPEAEAVEHLLVEYADARDAKKAAEERMTYAKASVDGIPIGEYGSMRLGYRNTTRSDYHGYADELARYYNADPSVKPSLESIKVPVSTTASVDIRPVRAATRAKKAKAVADAKARDAALATVEGGQS